MVTFKIVCFLVITLAFTTPIRTDNLGNTSEDAELEESQNDASIQNDQLEKYSSCSSFDKNDWTAWSPCSSSCGIGKRTRKCQVCYKSEDLIQEELCNCQECSQEQTQQEQPSTPPQEQQIQVPEQHSQQAPFIQAQLPPIKKQHQPQPQQQVVNEECFEFNIDYTAKPAKKSDVVNGVELASDCQDHCDLSPICNFFTLNLDNKKCWLKPSIGERKDTTGKASVFSGPKKCKVSKYQKHCDSKYFGEKNDVKTCTKSLEAAAISNNAFGAKVFQKLASQSENTVFSPYSLSNILYLTVLGSSGETRSQIEKGLKLSHNVSFESLVNETEYLLQGSSDVELVLATRIYAAKKVFVREEFDQKIKSVFGNDVGLVRVRDELEASREINKWVSENTDGKIPYIIQKGDISSTTRVLLVNALAFTGNWSTPFNPSSTKLSDFHVDDGQIIQTPTMQSSGWFRAAEIPNLWSRALELPFKGDQMSMVFILPDNGKTLMDIQTRLHDFDVDNIKWDSPESYQVYIPKFRIETRSELNENLKELGLTKMFDSSEADFSEMITNTTEKIFVSKIFQKTYINVNEFGVEAAASTVSSMSAKRMPSEFKVNRPFFFLIKDNVSGLILFMGQFHRP